MTLHPSSHYHRTIRSLIQVSNPWPFVCLLLLLYWVPCAEKDHSILPSFFHPCILPYFHTSIFPSFHSNHVSHPRGFCSCQGHRGPAGASCSGPAGASPSRPAGDSPSRPVGAYNISLVSSYNLHARIAILYTFLLPISTVMC